MAFQGGRFAALEWKNIIASKAMKVVIVAIGVIPLLYGALYLYAFLDPYTQLNTVPVAVVNEDHGAYINGEYRQVGNEVVDKLKNNEDGLGWNFVSADEAEAGLENGTYYMTCTIPSDFTVQIASADTDSPEHASLLIDYNESTNMLASQIGETVWKEVRKQVSDGVSEEYWNTTFNTINDGADSIRTASDGAYELKDGLTTAQNGSGTIMQNLSALHSGSAALNDGLRTLSLGTGALYDGTGVLIAGSDTLKSGTSQLSSGATQISDGAVRLQQVGTGVLAAGTQQLSDSTEALPNDMQVKEAQDGSAQIGNGVDSLKGAAGQLAQGGTQLQGAVGQLESGTAQLSNGLGASSDTAQDTTLFGGLRKLSEGGAQLEVGAGGIKVISAGLAEGSRELKDSVSTQLAPGAAQLRNGTAQVSDGLTTLKTGVTTLSGGAQQLQSGAADASAALSNLQAAQAAEKAAYEAAAAAYKAGNIPGGDAALAQAQSYAGTVDAISNGLSAKVGTPADAPGTATLCGGTNAAVAGIGTNTDTSSTTIFGGVNRLIAGVGTSTDTSSATLCGGANQLAEGIGDGSSAAPANTLTGGVNALNTFIGTPNDVFNGNVDQATLCGISNAVFEGTSTLNKGIGKSGDTATTTLYGGMNQVSGGVKQLSAGIGTSTDTGNTTLYGGVNQLVKGVGVASDTGQVTLYGGLNTLGTGFNTFSAQLMPLVEGAPQLRAAIVQLNAGAGEINTNTLTLASGASTLASGALTLDGSVPVLQSAAHELNDGALQLYDGSLTAYSGSTTITDGAQQLYDGSVTLTDGLTDAVKGSDTLGDKLADGAADMTYSKKQITDKVDVMSDPVQMQNEYYTDVKNYGTGFAPYFMALGLWVGALMCSFVFKPLNNRLIMAGGNPLIVAVANYIPLAIMSVLQATLLMVVLQFGLDLQIDNVPLYYAFGYLVALVFAAVLQLLTAAFGFPGKFIAIILLMLQLTSAAGTFPIEQTPLFFQTISPWLPMTYVVAGMRQIMSGLDLALAFNCAMILLGVGVGCFLLTALVAHRRRVVRMDQLHPVLELG